MHNHVPTHDLPLTMLDCPTIQNLAVPVGIMRHVARVESGFNPYAIGVVGGRLARQPRTLGEAVSTARMLEARGINFSLGVVQVNRYNLSRYGLGSYEQAFSTCPNLHAGARILRECYDRAGDWGKAFSCYYSGNFTTGYRHGYVQKVMASMASTAPAATPIPVILKHAPARARTTHLPAARAWPSAPPKNRPLPGVPRTLSSPNAAGGAGDSAFVF